MKKKIKITYDPITRTNRPIYMYEVEKTKIVFKRFTIISFIKIAIILLICIIAMFCFYT